MSHSPRMVIYYNSNIRPLRAVVGSAYSHVNLAFIVPTGNGSDQLELALSGNISASVLGDIPAAKEGGRRKILASLGGATFRSEDWQMAAKDVSGTAAAIAKIVEENGLDGVDIDFEDDSGFDGSYDGVTFLSELSKALKAQLPASGNLVSHAPQPPFFSPYWHEAPYVQIMEKAGNAIDFLNIQFYNNPSFQTPPSSTIVGDFVTSIPSLAKNAALPVEKLVMGKPVAEDDAGSGWLPLQQLVAEITEPLKAQFCTHAGGTMGWQFGADKDNKWGDTIADAQS